MRGWSRCALLRTPLYPKRDRVTAVAEDREKVDRAKQPPEQARTWGTGGLGICRRANSIRQAVQLYISR